MRAVSLQHIPFEGPGAAATSLTNLGASLDYRPVPSVTGKLSISASRVLS